MIFSCLYCGHASDEHSKMGCGLLLKDNQDCPCRHPFAGDHAAIIAQLPVEQQFIWEERMNLQAAMTLTFGAANDGLLTAHEELRQATWKDGPAV